MSSDEFLLSVVSLWNRLSLLFLSSLSTLMSSCCSFRSGLFSSLYEVRRAIGVVFKHKFRRTGAMWAHTLSIARHISVR